MPLAIADPDPLFVDRTCLTTPDETLLTVRFPGQSLVLAADIVGLSALIPYRKSRTQKLRSMIRRSRAVTVGSTALSRERSWAWPSSHGNTSVAISNSGS